MSTTLGQLQYRISKKHPGLDADYLLALINARHNKILNTYDWTHLWVDTILATVAKYDTGTVAVSVGGTSLTGTDTVWTAAMTGRRIRIASRNEFYVFTYVSATTATIDRAYEGTSAETAAAYRIWQPIYALPSDLDILLSLKVPSTEQDMDQITQELLDNIDPARQTYGVPMTYAPFEDSSSNLSQIELYPGNETAVGLPLEYRATVAEFTDTAETFLPWMDVDAIFYGVKADLFADDGKMNESMRFEALFKDRLSDMIASDGDRKESQQMQMSSRFTDHRVARTSDVYDRRWLQLHRSEPDS